MDDILMLDVKHQFQSYVYSVRNWLYHMGEYPKMPTPPPHIKSSCGRQNKNSIRMCIGFGVDYCTWGNVNAKGRIT